MCTCVRVTSNFTARPTWLDQWTWKRGGDRERERERETDWKRYRQDERTVKYTIDTWSYIHTRTHTHTHTVTHKQRKRERERDRGRERERETERERQRETERDMERESESERSRPKREFLSSAVPSYPPFWIQLHDCKHVNMLILELRWLLSLRFWRLNGFYAYFLPKIFKKYSFRANWSKSP